MEKHLQSVFADAGIFIKSEEFEIFVYESKVNYRLGIYPLNNIKI